MMDDRAYMTRALALARSAKGQTTPNPSVGCVIVKDGAVLSEGVTGGGERAWGPHGEVVALAPLGERARGATLYVTLEPCSFHGKTAPCVEAIEAAGIKKVVVGMIDPNPKVAGKGLDYLRSAGIDVELGLMGDACKAHLVPWSHFILTGRPWVVLKGGMSLDGKVATRAGHSKWITSPEAREDAHRLRAVSDAIMVGAGTALADDPSLTVRLAEPRGPELLRVIMDSALRLPLTAKVFNIELGPTLVFTSADASAERRKALEARGVEVHALPRGEGGLDLKAALEILGERGIVQLMVEGGPTLSASFIQAGLVNECVLYVAPRLIGGQGALGLIGGLGAEVVGDGLHLQFTDTTAVGPDIRLTARPIPIDREGPS